MAPCPWSGTVSVEGPDQEATRSTMVGGWPSSSCAGTASLNSPPPRTLSTLSDERRLPPEVLRNLERAYNMDKPLPVQYVLRMKLKRARELVTAGELPLAAVAQATGFASQSHMTSAFVRAFGVPPGQMRRQRREAGGPAL